MANDEARDLIQRLADALNGLSVHLEADSPVPLVASAIRAWKEARDYLAQLESEGPTPILLAERQPTEADCDTERKCWWFAPETDQKCAVWCFGPKFPPSMFGALAWLPCWAIPVPTKSPSEGD